ncbi:MAG: hypothetical protein HC908_18785 [Calothrix sp. SM1_7_51]|nr:hypothetical protein [Calothrix sp. SM1_7_51]
MSNGKDFPIPYPSELYLPTLAAFSSEKLTPKLKNAQSKSETLITNERQAKARNFSKVTSIHALVNHFIYFPDPIDRQVSLFIPGVEVKSYEKYFKGLIINQIYTLTFPESIMEDCILQVFF